MPYQPTDLPELRNELAQWYDDGWGDSYFESISEQAGRPITGIGHIDHIEYGTHTLRAAELFYVAPDMTDLAVHASKSIPDYFLEPEDLPSPAGLVYSPKPWWDRNPGGETGGEPAVGFAWGVIPEGRMVDTQSRHQSTVPGVGLAFLADRDTALAQEPDHVAEWARQHTPRLYEPREITFWEFGNTMAEDRQNFLDAGLDTCPALVIKSMWTLMQQTIAKTEDVRLDRATRRRLARQQIEPRTVRVITLRRPANPSDSGHTDREYHHQWIVRGHWRQQYYPSRDVHRPLWIAPHVKGPEDKPLLGGEKVHVWKR